MILGLTHELRNNVDTKWLAAGYHRGTEKPVRWAGSPTCSNWRGTEKSEFER
ncbi:hypothetical protein [Nostoc sp. C057]|uniref:hypothetical protein n=1 Tax=unclassified Nostoc TaxID=2593658 RepID=UPI0015C2E700|nr:hypothetical protein [Nostoc sp. C057]MBD2511627.1 hypothetical protein [Desmonostoc muscorum FACHB-395]